MTNRLFFDAHERRVARMRPTFTIGMRVVWEKCPHPELEGVVGTVKGIPCDDSRASVDVGTVAVLFERTLPGPSGGFMTGALFARPWRGAFRDRRARNNAN